MGVGLHRVGCLSSERKPSVRREHTNEGTRGAGLGLAGFKTRRRIGAIPSSALVNAVLKDASAAAN
jgi:hypothetical protein